ncbi:MAG TPA: hypothetical protein VFE44_02540, partial [Thermoanaerobaculia bacterium]|nr:hypothetical protein [Thermoanaerobaculia bacterium]
PHPFWPHFESFHILQLPTYTAKYHPAQGLFLAAGQRLAGHPAVGVWLSCAAMGAALAWMLAGWAPARWAVLGGLVATLRLAVGSYWGHSYWGGAVAAAAGALVARSGACAANPAPVPASFSGWAWRSWRSVALSRAHWCRCR